MEWVVFRLGVGARTPAPPTPNRACGLRSPGASCFAHLARHGGMAQTVGTALAAGTPLLGRCSAAPA
eukprot:4736928-Pyramimonas_sp.AAC.1